MVILCDTREQKNKHITDYFDKKKIKYKSKALKTGDYSFMVEACPELGFPLDTYFTDELTIEHKNSINELAGNLNEDRERFFKGINRMINIELVYFLVENSYLDDIIDHNYRAKYNELSFLRTLFVLQKCSNFYLNFVRPENSGQTIYEICRSCLMDKILK